MRLALLAARGLLKCPDHYKKLLAIFADLGMIIELEKEFMYSKLQYALVKGNDKAYEENQKELIKLIFPHIKSIDEELMQKSKSQINVVPKKLRIKTTGDAIKSENPMNLLKN